MKNEELWKSFHSTLFLIYFLFIDPADFRLVERRTYSSERGEPWIFNRQSSFVMFV